MTFQQTFQKITNSKVFQNFAKENPEAELVAGFFIIDFISKDNKKSLDYKIQNKIFTFSLNNQDEITMKEDKLIENSNQPLLKKISPEIKIELNKLKEIVEKEKQNNNLSQTTNKIIAVLQIHEEKQVWNLTCMLDNLAILHILINSSTGEIIKSEKKNMMDFIKKN